MGLDLISGRPYWLERNASLLRNDPPLTSDISCDVAIIGGGITGALIADKLTQQKYDTVLVDKRPVGCGSTSASTALVLYQTDIDLHQLIDRVGKRSAVRTYELGREAIADIEAAAVELGVDFVRRKSFYLASTDGDVRGLITEVGVRKENGFDVDFLDRRELAEVLPFDCPGALVSTDDAEVDPLALTLKLVRRAEGNGLRVFSETTIASYDAHTNGADLVTDIRHRIRARHVIFASGYETAQFLPMPDVQLKSTYVFVTHPINDFTGWHERALIWETARPYVYMRTTPDGRAMVGGQDEDVVDEKERDALMKRNIKRLEAKFARMFPKIEFTVAMAWAGTFSETADSLPYIGAHPKFPHAQFALGYGGNGISFGAIAARLICGTVCQIPNADADIFRFGRYLT